ncbi:MAG: hypothetical protein A2W31_02935 [Planctomycetes bacterium RBG_16_64_10]|nr:MAG: hypothetical protein A2W31_02935 [Planctomycetes bacterium RBG_16_64_10]
MVTTLAPRVGCLFLAAGGVLWAEPPRADSASATAGRVVSVPAPHRPRQPVVAAEEEVYRFEPANNGAGPMWCHGSTCIVRSGARVLASGIETLAAAKPLNNCLPLLFERTNDGWQLVYRGTGRTREPCPLATFAAGPVFLSINPTRTEPDVPSGPAQPQILQFDLDVPLVHRATLLPEWDGAPPFTEHSYRSLAADGARGELILLQNIGYTHAEWTFRDRHGNWAAHGQLRWPWGAEYDRPQPIRVCYPAVALKDRAVYFCGVSDIVEPYQAWREYKKQHTGKDWDYDFRRLFFTWSDDITTGQFHAWVEVASRDQTCGWIFPSDLYVAPGGDVLVLWTERALDERLRPRFFPSAKQRYALECAVLRRGSIIRRTTLVEGGEGLGGAQPGTARFQVTEDGRLLVFYFVGGVDAQGNALAENRLVEILPDGTLGDPVVVPLQRPLAAFFTATVRAGCRPAPILDVLGSADHTIRYAQIRLDEPAPHGPNRPAPASP